MNIILALLFSMLSMDQNKDLSGYEMAYNYIVEESCINHENNILVSDTVVYLDLVTFYEELSKLYKKDSNQMFLTLEQRDKELYFESYFVENLKFKRPEEPEFILYFSKRSENLLVAELLPFKKGLSAVNIEQVRAFSSSKVFLFIFDDDNQLSKVYQKEIEYN